MLATMFVDSDKSLPVILRRANQNPTWLSPVLDFWSWLWATRTKVYLIFRIFVVGNDSKKCDSLLFLSKYYVNKLKIRYSYSIFSHILSERDNAFISRKFRKIRYMRNSSFRVVKIFLGKKQKFAIFKVCICRFSADSSAAARKMG